jgi:hypothetical protein
MSKSVALFVLAGAAVLGPVGELIYFGFASLPPNYPPQMRVCVIEQFQKNGFDVAATHTTPNAGMVSGHTARGPAVTVNFTEDRTRVILSGSEFELPIVDDALGAVQRLADEISDHCVRSRREGIRSDLAW